MKHTKEQIELSESLLAACKAAGIEEPVKVIQEMTGSVWHVDRHPTINTFHNLWQSISGIGFTKLNHPPYAADWKESLLEWVEPCNVDNSLLDVLSNALASDKSADDACKVAYRAMTNEYAGRRTEADIYRRAWQDALKWKEKQ